MIHCYIRQSYSMQPMRWTKICKQIFFVVVRLSRTTGFFLPGLETISLHAIRISVCEETNETARSFLCSELRLIRGSWEWFTIRCEVEKCHPVLGFITLLKRSVDRSDPRTRQGGRMSLKQRKISFDVAIGPITVDEWTLWFCHGIRSIEIALDICSIKNERITFSVFYEKYGRFIRTLKIESRLDQDAPLLGHTRLRLLSTWNLSFSINIELHWWGFILPLLFLLMRYLST